MSVEHNPNEEGAKDTFDADNLHESGAKEDKGQDKDILHYAFVIAAEKPLTDNGEGVNDGQPDENDFYHQAYPEPPCGFLFKHTPYDGQD